MFKTAKEGAVVHNDIVLAVFKWRDEIAKLLSFYNQHNLGNVKLSKQAREQLRYVEGSLYQKQSSSSVASIISGLFKRAPKDTDIGEALSCADEILQAGESSIYSLEVIDDYLPPGFFGTKPSGILGTVIELQIVDVVAAVSGGLTAASNGYDPVTGAIAQGSISSGLVVVHFYQKILWGGGAHHGPLDPNGPIGGWPRPRD